MPTINQLKRKARKSSVKKTKTPAFKNVFNTIKSGVLDTAGTANRKRGRSKYGAKKEKAKE
jgi:ribosomal protein S12